MNRFLIIFAYGQPRHLLSRFSASDRFSLYFAAGFPPFLLSSPPPLFSFFLCGLTLVLPLQFPFPLTPSTFYRRDIYYTSYSRKCSTAYRRILRRYCAFCIEYFEIFVITVIYDRARVDEVRKTN